MIFMLKMKILNKLSIITVFRCFFIVILNFQAGVEAKPMFGDLKVFNKTADQTFSRPIDVKLSQAACEGDLREMKNLINKGANPNAISPDRSVSILAWSMECQNLSGFEELLKLGADPNTRLVRVNRDRDRFGLNLVTFSAGIDKPQYLRILLKYGGDPNSRATHSSAINEALHIAQFDNFENYDILLNKGIYFNSLVFPNVTIGDDLALMHRYDKVYELLCKGYNFRLDSLAWHLQTDIMLKSSPNFKTDSAKEQYMWAEKVKDFLFKKGIIFPLIKMPTLDREYQSADAVERLNAAKHGGALLNP